MLTRAFAEALAEAEKIIAGAPHIACEQDLAEGYDYLAGSIQASLRLAWAYQRDFPYFVQSTGPYTKMGLDNPDTLYFHAYLRDDAEYVVTGRRGTTADLSFQVLKGDYSPVEVPDSLSAFDDRAINIAADGSFELRFGPGRAEPGYFTLGAGSSMLLVREVYSDWSTERRGTINIRREDRAGWAPPPADTPAQGADVVLAARTAARLDDVAKEVTGLGRRGLALPADLADAAATDHLVEAALDGFGRVDALVYNALAMPPVKALGDVSLEALNASFDANVIAALRLTRLLTPTLAESQGSVVMINSMVVRFSQLTMGPYKLTKAALLAMAQSLATELGPRGIRVNSVAPGHIWGDSLKWYFGYLAHKRGVEVQEIYDETAAAIDLRRLPEPDEIADAVVFLASPLARAITGQCLDVNCGEYHH